MLFCSRNLLSTIVKCFDFGVNAGDMFVDLTDIWRLGPSSLNRTITVSQRMTTTSSHHVMCGTLALCHASTWTWLARQQALDLNLNQTLGQSSGELNCHFQHGTLVHDAVPTYRLFIHFMWISKGPPVQALTSEVQHCAFGQRGCL